jgi:putative aldouronate transport system substrate-binding protein
MDPYVRDAFYYGLEGENFNYDANGEIEKLNSDWTMAGYTQGTFFNITKLAGTEINQWDEVKELNANAKPSVLLGFSLDSTKIETELANCRAVYEKYRSELLTGAKEPRELVKKLRTELDAAGFQTILEEAQAQVNAVQ